MARGARSWVMVFQVAPLEPVWGAAHDAVPVHAPDPASRQAPRWTCRSRALSRPTSPIAVARHHGCKRNPSRRGDFRRPSRSEEGRSTGLSISQDRAVIGSRAGSRRGVGGLIEPCSRTSRGAGANLRYEDLHGRRIFVRKFSHGVSPFRLSSRNPRRRRRVEAKHEAHQGQRAGGKSRVPGRPSAGVAPR